MQRMRMDVAKLITTGLAAAVLSFGADRSLVGLVGADAQVVAGVQVDQVKGTALGQFLLKQMPTSDAHFQKFVLESGFDPRPDLPEFVVAAANNNAGELAVIRGTFDMAKIAALVKREGATLTKYNGYDVISHGDSHWVAFAENTIAVLGKAADVKAALARRESGPALTRTLLDRIDRVSGANDAWFLTTGLGPASGRGNVRGPLQALSAVQQASGGVRLGTVVQLSVEAEAKTEKDATALADVLRMLPGLSAGVGDQQHFQSMADLLDKLQVQASGTSVKALLPIPQAQVEQWIQDSQKSRARVRKTSAR